MSLIKIVFYIVVISLMLFLLEKKILKIERKKIADTSGKKIDRYGRIILIVLILEFYIQESNSYDEDSKWYLLILFSLVWGIQGILEWIYLRETRQYIATFLFVLIVVIFMLNIENIFG